MRCSDDGGLWLLALGRYCATGPYCAVYRYYRNTDKFHFFERATGADPTPVTGSESNMSEVKGTQAKQIGGENAKMYRQRVKRVG